MQVIEIITNIVLSVLDIKEHKIDGDRSLEELGLDSIATIKLIVRIEEELNISFDDKDLLIENLNTLNKICEKVQKYTVSK
ncbi:acyl carrier protein [Paenibacillus cymbidii]|uniref:acyl carrier protein n=1 Tax=Paenibacillus cymbidii TaxID=1639034 RepID=UPI0010812183|nr:acyl carrier protein [Paenibacillus cymbidii]